MQFYKWLQDDCGLLSVFQRRSNLTWVHALISDADDLNEMICLIEDDYTTIKWIKWITGTINTMSSIVRN